MLKKILITLTIIYIAILNLSLVKIKDSNNVSSQTTNKVINIKQKENIGNIRINKINLNQELFSINSSKNNIEENVTILKESVMPDKENSIVFLAAHSGTGKIAYFEDLDELVKDDIVELIYNNKKYKYIVKDIWEENKNGYINVNKENKNQLILTTCSPKNKYKQLIINCIEKES